MRVARWRVARRLRVARAWLVDISGIDFGAASLQKLQVKELKSFAKWAEVDKVQDVESDRLDALLVMYFEELWLNGN